MSDYNVADDIIYPDDSMQNWPVKLLVGRGVSQEEWDRIFSSKPEKKKKGIQIRAEDIMTRR